ncbi:MAG: hydroxymethylglutaryl-CoA lyase [Vicingaceae bacterium]
MSSVKLIECPRDAMQGIDAFIPTDSKIKYIQQLLSVGFDTVDMGSFVSPKAIPQLRDTALVLDKLDLTKTSSKLLTIIANLRGAKTSVEFDQITYLGFPFSISEEFQKRNTNASIEESLMRVDDIIDLCIQKKKELVIYISMAFGNPYREEWNADIAAHWVDVIAKRGVGIISLSDTIGSSTSQSIQYLLEQLIPAYPNIEFGAHLHTRPDDWREKVHAAYQSGCRRFDGAIRGFGGCPMASDDLVGNMPTENLIQYLMEVGQETGIDKAAFQLSSQLSLQTFPA